MGIYNILCYNTVYIKYIIHRILVIGDVASGKSSVIQKYVYKTFDAHYNTTLGVEFALKRVRVDGSLFEVLNIQLWDIAGQERYCWNLRPRKV